MTLANELREWALYDERSDVNNLTHHPWLALCSYRDHSFGFPAIDDAHLRTFALLVAKALETKDD